MPEKDVYKIFIIALAIAAILLGLSALVAAINLGGAIASGAIVAIFQFLITASGTLILLAITVAIISAVYSRVVERISRLEHSHARTLNMLNKRTPTFATSATLIAALVLLLADKSFNGETVPTVCVGVVLTVLFWIANELLIANSRPRRILGTVLWTLSIALLPTIIYLHRASDVERIIQDINSLSVTAISLLCLAFLVAFFAPIALKRND